MFDKSRIDAMVNKIASKPSDFSKRMADGKARAAANRVSSNAPPKASPPKRAPVSGTALNAVKPKATKIPEPASSGSGPTQHTAPGGHHINITIKGR